VENEEEGKAGQWDTNDDQDSWDSDTPEEHATTKDKLRHEYQQRRDARNKLVETVRQYGMVVLAALVLLPPHLVLVAIFCMALVYVLMKYGGLSSRRTTKPTG
jgi:hypothetical protein